MLISFLLPTNRVTSHKNVIDACINSIHFFFFNIGIEYEILVYSQDEYVGDKVVWIKEEKRMGPIYGFNLMSSIAKGDYLVCITDDYYFTNGVEVSIPVIDNSQFKVIGLNPGNFCKIPIKGDILGDTRLPCEIPIVSMIRFPFLRRDALKKLDNVIFYPKLFYHAGDIWLSYFLHMNGNLNSEGPTNISSDMNLKDSTWEVSDCKIVFDLITNYNPEKGYLQYGKN